MNENDKRLARKRARQKRKREKRFVHRTVVVSAGALCVLILAGVLLSRLLPGLYQKQAARALANGNAARAASIAARLDGEARQDILLQCDYQSAMQLYDSGDFAAAQSAFAALGDYMDAADMAHESAYQRAMLILADGDYTGARALLSTLLGHKDALYQYDLCGYRLAEATYAAGDYPAAVRDFLALGDFEDAHARAGDIAAAVTGLADPEAALKSIGGLDEAALARRAALAAVRESLKPGLVAAGFYHTLACRADGTVLFAGDNRYGQGDVSGWTDVIAVAAGARHSLALSANGTVLFAGDNSFSQGEVGGWSDIVAIAAGDYNSFALKRDGTVLSCGRIRYPALSGWRDAAAISAGAYALGAVRAGGGLLASHPSGADETMQNLVACAVSTGYSVGLSVDGRVFSSAFSLDDWQDIVAVSASPSAVLGLTQNGNIVSHFFYPARAVDFSKLTDVIAMDAGGTHFAFAHADGRVTVLGENDLGQCDTSDWMLK